jgi:hypothetical protein
MKPAAPKAAVVEVVTRLRALLAEPDTDLAVVRCNVDLYRIAREHKTTIPHLAVALHGTPEAGLLPEALKRSRAHDERRRHDRRMETGRCPRCNHAISVGYQGESKAGRLVFHKPELVLVETEADYDPALSDVVDCLCGAIVGLRFEKED